MNNSLDNWAIRHNISPAALVELRMELIGKLASTSPITGQSEAGVQNAVRLEASRAGILLMRNNVGVLKDERGIPVRFGLANDSVTVNRTCKSSDLIGVRPVEITPEMVGHTIGQFVARECKKQGWHYVGNEREKAQLHFLELINAMGGDAAFASEEGTL